jgi:tetratricopeptide (TPR) repeat protein
MSDRYEVTTLDGLGGPAIPGQARWHTIRRTLGIASFGINAWTATEDDQQIIGEHDEASGEGHEELYVVLSGHATFALDGKAVDAPQGTLVFVSDPAVKRGAVAAAGTTILVVGAKPGEVFTPSEWERSAEALRFWPTEEWDKAIEVLEGHLADTPKHGGTHYNLACAYARAGRLDVALDHLVKAVELQGSFAEYAANDDDLASLRDDPRFPRPSAAPDEPASG